MVATDIYWVLKNIPKIMASDPITSWEIDGETVETVFIFWGSKIAAPLKWTSRKQ